MNLPAADKMVEPYFTMLWDEDIPRHVVTDDDGRTTEITVIAGELAGLAAAAAAADSWASRPEADLAIWHVVPSPERGWTLPPAAGADTVRTLYVFEGSVAHRRARPPRRRPARCCASDERGRRSTAGPTAPRRWCCRAARSASRSRSTGRS